MESKAFQFCKQFNVPDDKRQEAAQLVRKLEWATTSEEWIESAQGLIGIIKVDMAPKKATNERKPSKHTRSHKG